MKPLSICMVSSEVAPLAKTGGLADVSAALVRYLTDAGHDVRLLMPAYDTIDRSALNPRPVPGLDDLKISLGDRALSCSIETAHLPDGGPAIYFLRCPAMYGRGRLYTSDPDEHLRFVLLSRAAIEMCQRMAWAPDILHCNDWHTALIPLYLRTLYHWDRLFARTKTVLTIHNIAYQGVVDAACVGDLGLRDSAHLLHGEDLAAGVVNFMKTGILFSDLVTTVSPTYCLEIQTDEGGMGLGELLRARSASVIGILNGVDYSLWDPENDPWLTTHYSKQDLAGKARNKRRLRRELGLEPGARIPLVGMVSRLTWQKGIDLVQDVLPEILSSRPLQMAVLGAGEPRYENFFESLQRHFPGRVCFYRGYSEELAHLIEAGADMFLMPSAFEPCGLNQMYSLRYGTVPIVRATGGLADSVRQFDPDSGEGTGIVFEHFDSQGLRWALTTALDLYSDRRRWTRLRRNGMSQDFSWERQGLLYVEAFRRLLDSDESRSGQAIAP